MEPFLKIVAEDLYGKFGAQGGGLADITVVFPNRRARLFFDDFLSACSAQPVWSPQYTTIEELFQSQSDLRPASALPMTRNCQVTHRCGASPDRSCGVG